MKIRREEFDAADFTCKTHTNEKIRVELEGKEV